MVVPVMKANFRKLEPKKITYRNYRYFSNYKFREKVRFESSKVVLENSDKGFHKFFGTCKEPPNMYAPLKNIYIRGNNSPFMYRILSKKIMKRSKLRNKFLKSKSKADNKIFVKQRNYCVSLLSRMKKEDYGNLDPKKVVDNRTFWRNVKPFRSNKFIENEKIILAEKEEILTNDSSVAKVPNNFFSNIVKTQIRNFGLHAPSPIGERS